MPTEAPTLNLLKALRLGNAPRLAVVGAGGKTTFIFQLAREFTARAPSGTNVSVLVTTTTHLGTSQVSLADHHLVALPSKDLEVFEAGLPPGVVLVTGAATADQRVSGVGTQVFSTLIELCKQHQAPLLVEADGARQRSLKAPADHEPALPAGEPNLDVVVVVAGMTGLEKALSPEWVHRPEIFSRLSGVAPGEVITAQALVRVLNHPEGGLKGIHPGTRRVALLNQCNTPELQAQASGMAKALLEQYEAVVVADLPGRIPAVHEPVAGIILAAGESRRFGQPKQVLPWRGQPLIRHVAQTARDAGLSPLIVVCGAHSQEIRAALGGLPVELVYNPDWELGQSTSVRCGLEHLPHRTGAAIFLLADQPQVPVGLLDKLVETHAASLSPLVAPQADGRRANPVLFDRVTFPDLLQLQGDVGGRSLFARYTAEWVPWHDASLLLDVDTPEDYARLLEIDR